MADDKKWTLKGRFTVESEEMQTSFTLCSTNCMEEDASYLCDLLNEMEDLRAQTALYRRHIDRATGALMWMHDDKTLGLKVGDELSVDGVAALKAQRDALREKLILSDDIPEVITSAQIALRTLPRPTPQGHPSAQ